MQLKDIILNSKDEINGFLNFILLFIYFKNIFKKMRYCLKNEIVIRFDLIFDSQYTIQESTTCRNCTILQRGT